VDDTTFKALAAFPDQLEAHYGAVPAEFVNWTPPSWEGIPSEHFTALEQVCHVRDIEIDGYHVRIRRILQETNPTLASIDSERLAVERNYAGSDAAEAFAAFRAGRAQTLDMIRQVSSEQLARTGTFEGYGALSLSSLIHYLCSHDQQHLAGLQWLMGKIEAAGPLVLRARVTPHAIS
jgi:DinB superfamily